MHYRKAFCVVAAAFLLLSGPGWSEAKDTIYILATGGTIAGAQGSSSEPGYKAGSFKVEDLIKAVPQLKDLADLKGEQISNIGSQTMNDEVWLKLAKRVNELLKRSDVDGIVITHGTDTFEETAYFLNLVTKSKKPVVMTASMRPATAISADGPMNLYMATYVATLDEAEGRGVLCVMNNEIHHAAVITKTMTVNLATMKSPNRGLAGKCDQKICRFYAPTVLRHTTKSEFEIAEDVTSMPTVEIVYAHANATQGAMNAAVKAGAEGIIIAGVGDGNMTDDMLAGATALAKQGIVIVRSTHVGTGAVKRNIELDDDKLGFVAAMHLNPQKARVLLQQGLRKTKDVKKIQQMFLEY